MHRTTTARLVLVPLVAAAAASLVAARASRAAPQEAVELEVLGILTLDADASNLLVLRQKGTPTVLPIFVGQSEGAAIRQRLGREPARHPLAADLLQHTIDALGAKVVRVEIEGEHVALFRARVTLQQGNRRLDVEARPSDSVALAIASRAPIFATRDVMAEAGLTKEDLERMHGLEGHGDEESAAPSSVVTF